MKKAVLLLMIIGVLTLNSCQTKKQTDDPEKLKAVLMEYFDAIKAKDLQKMKDLCTTDYVLFENGKVFNNDSLFNLISRMQDAKIAYKFDNFKISVDNHTGQIRYYNYGDFIINDTIHMNMNWIESAALRKIDDAWKLEFLHSTVRQ